MEKVKLEKGDSAIPDRVKVAAWNYCFNIVKDRTEVFSFDGEKIHVSPSVIHNTVHDRLKTDDLLDFRYFYQENVLSVWIYDEKLIIPQLKLFEAAYRKGDWKPFDIDKVWLIFSQDGYAVKCLFSELDTLDGIEENYKRRVYHVMPPSLKNLVVDKNEKQEYF